MKYKIYMTLGLGSSEIISDIIETDNTKEIWTKCKELIDNIKFKMYYYRTIYNEENLRYIIDFGSHSKFITVECDSLESFKNANV